MWLLLGMATVTLPGCAGELGARGRRRHTALCAPGWCCRGDHLWRSRNVWDGDATLAVHRPRLVAEQINTLQHAPWCDGQTISYRSRSREGWIIFFENWKKNFIIFQKYECTKLRCVKKKKNLSKDTKIWMCGFGHGTPFILFNFFPYLIVTIICENKICDFGIPTILQVLIFGISRSRAKFFFCAAKGKSSTLKSTGLVNVTVFRPWHRRTCPATCWSTDVRAIPVGNACRPQGQRLGHQWL